MSVEPYPNRADIGSNEREASLPRLGFWSKIPSKFFGSGTAAKIGTSASLFYLALCEHGNRNESNTFRASDKALAADTGLSTRKICDSRKAVLEEGLITCDREHGSSFVYTLLPLELKWVPMEERVRQKRKPRGLRTARTTEGSNQKGEGGAAKLAEPRTQDLLNRPAKFADPPSPSLPPQAN